MEKQKETVNYTHNILQLVPLSLQTFVQVSCVDEDNKPSSEEEEVYCLALVQTTAKFTGATPLDRYQEILPVIMADDSMIDIEENFVGSLYHTSKEKPRIKIEDLNNKLEE